MTKKTRRILFWVGVAIFLIGGYVSTLYANGYRFNWRERKFMQTGAILLKTFPKKSEVFLNGKNIGRSSLISGEFTKKFILPGEYEVKASSPGRKAWTKTIKVKAKEVERFENIYLPPERLELSKINPADMGRFFTDSPKADSKLQVLPKDGRLFRVSQNEKPELISNFVFDKKYKAWDVFTFNNQYFIIAKISGKSNFGTLFKLDQSGDKILLENISDLIEDSSKKKIALLGKNEINVLWLKNEDIPPHFKEGDLSLIVRLSSPIQKVAWFQDNSYLLFLADEKLFMVEVDLRDRKNLHELTSGVSDFTFQSEDKLLIKKTDGEVFETRLD